MGTITDDQESNVVQLPIGKTISASDKKWGKAVMKLGFSIVPSLLLRAQNRLGLNPTQLAVLMQLCDFWWDNDRKPYPAKKILAERLGISERQVQRYIAELEKAGLVSRTQRYAIHGGKLSNSYDLDGLVKKLKNLEPDFRKVEENVKSERTAVTKSGYRQSRKISSSSN